MTTTFDPRVAFLVPVALWAIGWGLALGLAWLRSRPTRLRPLSLLDDAARRRPREDVP
ncbi:MAG TPA: hypothetical protein PK743_10420 [Luteimonas sp.]|nr:hypothetical protein [Luteimonas sp.]HRO25928.1 hypothetical protein [Luteimonas sp.]HRP73036.1 hypothetical protein [Luteimonas sp.]